MTVSAFLAVALMSLMAAISPGPAVLMAACTGVAEGMRAGAFAALGIGAGAVVWASAAILAVVFLNETLWNVAVARIFSLGRSRRAYLGLKGWIDRAFGGALALLGLKLAAS